MLCIILYYFAASICWKPLESSKTTSRVVEIHMPGQLYAQFRNSKTIQSTWNASQKRKYSKMAMSWVRIMQNSKNVM